jgi:hypothetical protein
VYGISVAAELVGVDAQSLRLYERRGLLEPARPMVAPAATAAMISTGSAASSSCSPPGSTSPAYLTFWTSKPTTPSYATNFTNLMPCRTRTTATTKRSRREQATMPDALATLTDRLYTDYQPGLTHADIDRVVHQCRADLARTPDTALPELLERLARQRLNDQRNSDNAKGPRLTTNEPPLAAATKPQLQRAVRRSPLRTDLIAPGRHF